MDGPNPTATVTVASSLPPVGTVTCTLVGQKAGSSPSTYGPLNLAVGPPGSPSTAKQAKFVLSLAGKPADDYNIQVGAAAAARGPWCAARLDSATVAPASRRYTSPLLMALAHRRC